MENLDPLFFEKILINFLFSDEGVRDKIQPFLTPDIFEGMSNKQIIQKIILFTNKNNKFPTIPEMKLEIQNQEVYDGLVECLDLDTTEYDKKFILEKIEDFFKRKMIWNEIINAKNIIEQDDISDIGSIPDRIREKVAFSFNTEIGLDVFSDKGEERMFKFLHDKDIVVPSGIPYFDKIIDGGFHEKSLTLFLAETNLGKSLIKCALATNALLQNKKVLYISLEMSEEMITQRILTNLFDVEIGKLKYMNREKFHNQYSSVRKKIRERLFVQEYPPRGLNCNQIRNLLKELKVKQKFIPDIIFVDYLGLMVPNNSKREHNSYSEQKLISEELRAIGVDFVIPIVSAVQTNRGGFSSAAIDLTNTADSIGTVATADLIIGVTQSDEFREAGLFCWIILKNRFGINKLKKNVGVDYLKMRIFPDANEAANSNGFQQTQTQTNIVDNAAVSILTKMRTDKKEKRKSITGIEM